jgi:hypothetical protein
MERKQTIIPVKRKGVVTTKIIDEERNEKIANEIRGMIDKSTIFDIFYNAEVDSRRINEK